MHWRCFLGLVKPEVTSVMSVTLLLLKPQRHYSTVPIISVRRGWSLVLLCGIFPLSVWLISYFTFTVTVVFRSTEWKRLYKDKDTINVTVVCVCLYEPTQSLPQQTPTQQQHHKTHTREIRSVPPDHLTHLMARRFFLFHIQKSKSIDTALFITLNDHHA